MPCGSIGGLIILFPVLLLAILHSFLLSFLAYSGLTGWRRPQLFALPENGTRFSSPTCGSRGQSAGGKVTFRQNDDTRLMGGEGEGGRGE